MLMREAVRGSAERDMRSLFSNFFNPSGIGGWLP